ncbi:hypothetical protein [Kitasatospora sp. NPDC088134]|uniref:hypothetical protein n=1 Tax=Kitasatospora sp. NPDC088134 TaxID=3364071 RepID=UPI0037F84C16
MSTPRTVAPWVSTRLRATPAAAWLAAALVLVSVFLAAALPRALDRSADGALRAHLRSGDRDGSVVSAVSMRLAMDPKSDFAERLDVFARSMGDAVRAPLVQEPGGVVYGTNTVDGRDLDNPELPRPMSKPPVLGLSYLHAVDGQAALAAGRWPEKVSTGPVTDFEVALSEQVAAKLGVSVGTVLDAGGTSFTRFRATVVGLFRPTAAASSFWSGTDCLLSACLATSGVGGDSVDYWKASALVGPKEIGNVMGIWSSREPQDFVRVPIDVSKARADQVPQLRKALGTLTGGPKLTDLQNATGRRDLVMRSGLPRLLDEAQQRQEAVTPLTVLGPAGAAGVALTVLLLAAALTDERRVGELRLLRARGASRPGVLRRLLGESAVTALPAALVATVLALVLLPTPRWGGALVCAATTTLVALLVFPLRAALFPDAGRAGGRRRVVAELLVLLLAAAAAVAVRRRGVAPAGAGVDLLLVSAPLLIALAGALLLARVLPALVRLAARVVAARSGAVGFLALTRAAGRGERRPTLLPLLALMLAVTTAGFGGTLLDSVDQGRLRAVRADAGADARVLADTPLPSGFAAAAEQLPGVRGGLSAWTDREASVGTADSGLMSNVTVVVVDPVKYAELADRNGRGGFDPALLAGGGPDWVPALVTPALASRLDDASRSLHTNPWSLTFRKVGTITGGPALTQGEAVVVPARQSIALVPQFAAANLWLGTGSVHADELRALLQRLDPRAAEKGAHYGVRSAADEAAALADDPMQHAAAKVFLSSVAAAGGFAVLAVLLTLVRSGPERAALLARLRTMGLRPRQGLAVILVEALPTALGAAVAGALLALGAVLLLGPAVDLSALVGVVTADRMAPSVPTLLGQALVLLALFSVTVLAEALVSGRRQIAAELRAGDER